MQYFWSFFWTFCLVQMFSYVTSQMNNVPYDFKTASILAVIVTIFVYIIAAVIPKDSTGHSAH